MIDPEPPDPQEQPTCQWTKGKELNGQQRQDAVARLLWECKDTNKKAKFPKGVLTAVAQEFHVTHDTIRRVWARALLNFNDPAINQFRASPLTRNNRGRAQK